MSPGISALSFCWWWGKGMLAVYISVCLCVCVCVRACVCGCPGGLLVESWAHNPEDEEVCVFRSQGRREISVYQNSTTSPLAVPLTTNSTGGTLGAHICSGRYIQYSKESVLRAPCRSTDCRRSGCLVHWCPGLPGMRDPCGS